ncbi:hypothetical protein MPSEU_000518000 [Mayamaea pseudoterrestris]|nr:hypothetical protein MPSEU_000518000 [Mayamaea pseudoterrestris]
MTSKKKENRSDWVAVEPEFSNVESTTIRKAQSAYSFFQAAVTAEVKEQVIRETGKFDIAVFGRNVRERWNGMSADEKQPFTEMAQRDSARFEQESSRADLQALERAEKLRQERDQLFVESPEDILMDGVRTTRRKLEKKRKNKHKKEELNKDAASDESSASQSSNSQARPKKVPRQISQKQQEHLAAKKVAKVKKEQYITARQEDLRKERAEQANRRLEYLLKQSNIFSHFGRIKQDALKYGTKSGVASATMDKSQNGTGASSRRDLAKSSVEEELDALEEADEHEAIFLTKQPSTIGHGQMRDYQLEGLNWMIRLQENGVNGILADEMGLGKTLQSISVLVYMNEYRGVTGPHIVCVPKSTLSQWMNEFARWAPTLKAIRFHGDRETRESIIKNELEPAMRDEERTWNVIVTTYEVCNMERATLGRFTWSYLIIDEAHRLKNDASTFSQTVRTFETRYRLLLTGTPLQNSLLELWALLNFLVPDVFESAEQFDQWFNLDIDDNNEKNKLISQLHKILRPFMLRRLKADVEKSLPPKHETILFTGMSKMQKDLYRNILARDIDAFQGTSGNRTAILNIVMQLRKCAGHPYLFPGVEDRSLPPLGDHLIYNCGKMALLDKLLKRLFEQGHRVLLFTQMTKILDILEDYLVMRRYQYCRIDGNTSYDDREKYIDTYNEPGSEKFIFLLSTRAGGLGINLQTADIVILYDSDWNPQADLQAYAIIHRIGQKRSVQVFRLVTEHTIEEKIVERAQQKLKLDAMVVQQGRLKDKDKLSRDELLAAVRFGADKIFKSKDSSITDDDIDLILDAGKRKTQELNDKLQAADKGDLLDFKLDGSSVQTFEGVDYSANAIAHARAEADMLNIFDIGKRERKEANYNENSLYQQQMASSGTCTAKKSKKKVFRLPKHLRLPRMEEWQMYDRESLLKIQEEEEAAFKALPEEDQKAAIDKLHQKSLDDHESFPQKEADGQAFELSPLISSEKQTLKEKLLSEGFSGWLRTHFNAFVKACAHYGRHEYQKIAAEVGKSEQDVKVFANAFWGELGRARFSAHEYDRAVKMIERGEKKISEIGELEGGIRVLVSLFDNPWQELEFSYVNCRDKMFSFEEDRHLICWMRKYGYGQWQAIRMAIRRNPLFRFDYFFRSLPIDQLIRRCEQLAKAAKLEVEQIERKARESAGLPTDSFNGEALPPIQLPKFRVYRLQQRKERAERAQREKQELEDKVADIESQIREVQARLKAINEGSVIARLSPLREELVPKQSVASAINGDSFSHTDQILKGYIVAGTFKEFPAYDGSEKPIEWKKPFTHFCVRSRKDVKASLSPADRKNKEIIHNRLKEQWLGLSAEEKAVWKEWSAWDKSRFARDMSLWENCLASSDGMAGQPKAKVFDVVPEKKRKASQKT